MQAIELIGKKAIRKTQPDRASTGKDFTTCPIFIEKVTDTHIIYSIRKVNFIEGKSMPYKSTEILGADYLDDNWVDYENLIVGTSLEKPGSDAYEGFWNSPYKVMFFCTEIFVFMGLYSTTSYLQIESTYRLLVAVASIAVANAIFFYCRYRMKKNQQKGKNPIEP